LEGSAEYGAVEEGPAASGGNVIRDEVILLTAFQEKGLRTR